MSKPNLRDLPVRIVCRCQARFPCDSTLSLAGNSNNHDAIRSYLQHQCSALIAADHHQPFRLFLRCLLCQSPVDLARLRDHLNIGECFGGMTQSAAVQRYREVYQSAVKFACVACMTGDDIEPMGIAALILHSHDDHDTHAFEMLLDCRQCTKKVALSRALSHATADCRSTTMTLEERYLPKENAVVVNAPTESALDHDHRGEEAAVSAAALLVLSPPSASPSASAIEPIPDSEARSARVSLSESAESDTAESRSSSTEIEEAIEQADEQNPNDKSPIAIDNRSEASSTNQQAATTSSAGCMTRKRAGDSLKHVERGGYMCEYCGASRPSKVELEVHRRLEHTKDKQLFSCDECDHQTISAYRLKQHKNLHELNLWPPPPPQPFPPPKKKQSASLFGTAQRKRSKVECPFCEETFRSDWDFLKHRNLYHSAGTKSIDDQE